jgi:hypothetical protein
MIDRDSSYAYSQIQSVRLGTDPEIIVFPNPLEAGNQLRLLLDNAGEVSHVKICDLSGKVLQESDIITDQINTNDLPSGRHILRITLKDGRESSHGISKK